MATYKIFIVTRNARHHYPVIMANNGKAILNEPVKRAKDLDISINNFFAQVETWKVPVVRITEKAFRAKFPKFAPNKGPKKKAVKKAASKNKPVPQLGGWVPKPGDCVVCDKKPRESDNDCGWVPDMKQHIGKPMQVSSDVAWTLGAIRAEGRAWMVSWLRPAKTSGIPAKAITKKTTKTVK